MLMARLHQWKEMERAGKTARLNFVRGNTKSPKTLLKVALPQSIVFCFTFHQLIADQHGGDDLSGLPIKDWGRCLVGLVAMEMAMLLVL